MAIIIDIINISMCVGVDDECCVSDGVVGPFGFGLGVFEVVYILRDTLTIKMVPLYLVFECEDIKGMESPILRV